MGNSLGIEIFRSQVDVCMAIDGKTSGRERDILAERVIRREEMRGRYLILGGSPESIASESPAEGGFCLVFIRMSVAEFKQLMLEIADELQDKMRFSITLTASDSQEGFYILRDSLGSGQDKLEFVIRERLDPFDPVKLLVSHFELEDFLERYAFKSAMVKTLSLFDCLDEQEPVQVHGVAEKTDLSHFVHINIGKSYTEFLHFVGDSDSKRVGGIEIGEYTFWGLAKILDLKVESMEDIDRAISVGNIENCDLIVKDIYGQSYPEINLEADSVASSLGKLQFTNNDQRRLAQEDLIKSIVILLTNQLVQKGMLHSKILQENNIVISGFVSGSPKIMAAIHNTFQAHSEDFNVFFIKSIVNIACIQPRAEASS
ncbi:pantothenate kinase 4-like protein [Cryptosporidium canis]|uniref:Pantothenate kinase 4-like protein n=1 Tax=Cryptosporidium canis TaxID=195482 RepID=A0ABQ8P9D9_9CRYT|nr:pantothenate kinase 4-like protein [Cryptosporidium canis]